MRRSPCTTMAKSFLDSQCADLDAFNGSYGFDTNSLSGDLWVNGTRYRMDENGEPLLLNPDFDQEEFDATYACKENLLEVVPAAQ